LSLVPNRIEYCKGQNHVCSMPLDGPRGGGATIALGNVQNLTLLTKFHTSLVHVHALV
jgi:hypothetical protein